MAGEPSEQPYKITQILALPLGALERGISQLVPGKPGVKGTFPGTALPLPRPVPFSRHPASPPPHLSPVLGANCISRKAGRGHHAQRVAVGTPQGGCVRPGHKGAGRQALQPRGPPAGTHQLQPQPQLRHFLLLLPQPVALEDKCQVLMGDAAAEGAGMKSGSAATPPSLG